MTISELTLKSRDEEPVRRLEIFTGSGRRREWLPDEKARIVAESYEVGETVSAVARRYALQASNFKPSALQRPQPFAVPLGIEAPSALGPAALGKLLLDWFPLHDELRRALPRDA